MVRGRILPFFDRIFRVLSSLKLAVLVILSLAVSMGVATFLESLYDTPTAQYWIYRAGWFHGVLALLGLNILCVALSRYPWKKKHIPFLMAHAGILILLFGSFLTDRLGTDGNLRVTEGETARIVELDSSSWIIGEGDQIHSIPVRWIPPGVIFTPISAVSMGLPYELKVDRFLSHAEPLVSFIPNREVKTSYTQRPPSPSLPALHLRLAGGPMGISQDFWLWEGSESWKSFQAGPARIFLENTSQANPISSPVSAAHPRGVGQPWISLRIEKEGGLSYVAQSSEGKQVKGWIPKNKGVGQIIRPGWKGNMTLTLAEWVPDAIASTTYKAARVQYGPQAPTSAIHVVGPQGVDIWLGLGDRAVLHLLGRDQVGRDLDIGYFPKRIVLPFSIRLERFTVEHDQGTMTPASYSSRVTTFEDKGQRDVTISMNEPLEMGAYTLYQASYEEGDPRPLTSIFAVNRDPGRIWKYLGSLLIVLGSILLFGVKYKRSRSEKKAGAVMPALHVRSVSEASL